MTEEERSDRVAWIRSMLERYEGPLTRYAGRITGNTDLAREVVQETFLRLCDEKRGVGDDHVAEWLYTVCRNRALDVRRKERRMQAINEVHQQSCECRDPSPAAEAENRESGNRVLRVLVSLPQNQQEVIRLRFQEGLSYRQISHVTGHTVGNVGFLIHTAIKTMRAKLGAEAVRSSAASRSQS